MPDKEDASSLYENTGYDLVWWSEDYKQWFARGLDGPYEGIKALYAQESHIPGPELRVVLVERSTKMIDITDQVKEELS